MALGMESVYGDNEVGSDGLTRKGRKFQKDSIAYDKMIDEMTMKEFANVSISDFDDGKRLDELFTGRGTQQQHRIEERRTTANTKRTRPVISNNNIPTVKSRDAAAALSGAKPASIRARPAPVRLPRTRVAPSATSSSKKDRLPTNPSTMRNTAAVANSRTTLGYSKGRRVSSVLHGTAPQAKKQTILPTANLSPKRYMELYGSPPLGSEMWIRCKTAGCFDDDDSQENQGNEAALPTFNEEDEEAQNFQLTL